MAVGKKQHALAQLDLHGLVDLDIGTEDGPQVTVAMARALPVDVVVAPDADVAPRVHEPLLERELLGVLLDDARGVVLPELLGVAQHDEPVATAEVVRERRPVGPLGAVVVVGAVARPAVLVGEDRQAQVGQLRRQPQHPLPIERPREPPSDLAAVEAVVALQPLLVGDDHRAEHHDDHVRDDRGGRAGAYDHRQHHRGHDGDDDDPGGHTDGLTEQCHRPRP
jgi:hypothetical protein